MAFSDLPNEIHEMIYDRLNIIDRCTFDRVAKLKHIRRDSAEMQKKLGVLYKLIQKKELTALSIWQLRTLTTYNRLHPNDPTIQEIAMTFPEVFQKTPEFLYEKIKRGTITDEDIQNMTESDLNTVSGLYELISHQNVAMFKRLYTNAHMIKYVYNWRTTISSYVIYDCNEEMFLYMRDNKIFGDEFNFDSFKCSIDLIKHVKIRKFLMKHFTYSAQEIEEIKQVCLELLYIDAYLEFR